MENNPVIDSQRALVARLRSELALAEAVLTGMELVQASYTNGKSVSLKATQAPKVLRPSAGAVMVGGKPKGSISLNWRKVLASFYRNDVWFSEADTVAREMEINGRELNTRAVRRLFEGYIELGFLEVGDGSLYRVTDTAAERFGFDRAPLGERVVNEADAASEGLTSASSLFSSQEGGDGHAANNTDLT